jgi:putative tryptophan/tyrosine transport system substrate-binding protein
MRRRDFIMLLGGGAAALWPRAGAAQRSQLPVLGFLGLDSAKQMAPYTAWFIRGLSEVGFADGKNVAIEYRWAEGQYDRLPVLAADLVQRRVAVIFSSGGTPPLRAAMAATKAIPIIFSLAGDPVKQGIVSSMNRPGGNVTGVTFTTAPLGAKRLELVRELIPGAQQIGLLVNPASAGSEAEQKQLESVVASFGARVVAMNASNTSEIDAAFAKFSQQRIDALLVPPDAFLTDRREQLVALAAQHAVPTVYFEREFVASGGLISYGVPLRESYHQAGVYAGQILKGAKAAELPIVQATRFELVINLTTAKALGINIPDKLIALADEVIE